MLPEADSLAIQKSCVFLEGNHTQVQIDKLHHGDTTAVKNRREKPRARNTFLEKLVAFGTQLGIVALGIRNTGMGRAKQMGEKAQRKNSVRRKTGEEQQEGGDLFPRRHASPGLPSSLPLELPWG